LHDCKTQEDGNSILPTRIATNVIKEIMSLLNRFTLLKPKRMSRPHKLRRSRHAQLWKLRISSAAMDRRGVKPMPTT